MTFGERKKTGFHTKVKKPLKRSAFSSKTLLKGYVVKPKPRKKPKRTKLPTVKKMRNKCDKLLTPIIKAQHPYCYLKIADGCAGFTEVAHHHIKKSQSSAVRYDIENLIPLCHRCHCKLHSQETTWSSLVVEKKGVNWWKKLYIRSVHYTKCDVHFYIENHERLSKILEELQGN